MRLQGDADYSCGSCATQTLNINCILEVTVFLFGVYRGSFMFGKKFGEPFGPYDAQKIEFSFEIDVQIPECI